MWQLTCLEDSVPIAAHKSTSGVTKHESGLGFRQVVLAAYIGISKMARGTQHIFPRGWQFLPRGTAPMTRSHRGAGPSYDPVVELASLWCLPALLTGTDQGKCWLKKPPDHPLGSDYGCPLVVRGLVKTNCSNINAWHTRQVTSCITLRKGRELTRLVRSLDLSLTAISPAFRSTVMCGQ